MVATTPTTTPPTKSTTASVIKMMLIYILLAYLGLGSLLFFFQKSFIYFPVKGPAQHGLNTQEFKINGEIIEVYVLNPGKPKALIYFGGNAEVVAYNADDFSRHLKTYTIYLVNYRGYGASTGSPSEQGLYADALAIFDLLDKRHQQLSIIGRSLGSGVATYVGSKREIQQLILITPFDSIENIAKKRYPIYPISILLREKYDSLGRVGQISAATLVILAEHDQLVRRERSENLIAAFKPEQVNVQIIPDVGHNDVSQPPLYMQSIKHFLL